jgi:hypothetical protein
MQRDSGVTKDHPLIVFAVLVGVMVLMLWALYNNPAIYHGIYVPWLKTQSTVYATVAPSVYLTEKKSIERIALTLDSLSERGEIGKVNVERLRYIIAESTQKTRLTTKILTASMLFLLGVIWIASHIKNSKARFSKNENLNVAVGQGVDGFIKIIEPHVDKDIVDGVRNDPSPQNLSIAFSRARYKKNIPNNLAGRMFPTMSEERLTILEVGKEKTYKREEASGA